MIQRKTILYIATSLDGYISTEDGSVSWLDPYHSVDLGEFSFFKFMESVDVCFMGRKTYEQVLTFGEWPYKDQDSFVFSRKSIKATTPRTVVTEESPATVVKELKMKPGKNFWLIGGGLLNGEFLKAGLIDELLMFVMPVSLGKGRMLFGGQPQSQMWDIVERRDFDKGVSLVRAVPGATR